ncbi:dol-P-Man:Man(5)GlcNAc(2)-PP-Dol alpha-1,3-mannosyltransferase-like [Rhopilema esculentum]|uniref:dol-P-Man:Man(5)GlcNAc(2)-PP-Dol alpha-1,3-mannosyltransferase-like n=1 Tax=Rhopilema esculentum TaxID=499914 RepID=UPI0031CEF368
MPCFSAICVSCYHSAFQILLGLPFLLTNPVAYVARSFDLGRQFFFTWTVNWRFLPEWLFLNRYFHFALLLLHIITLITFWIKKWPRPASGWSSLLTKDFVGTKLDATSMLEILFASNFIGMCFSRSLHYQFYVWYFHTLPFLLWRTDLITPVKILILGLLELCWNTYPSTSASSLTIHACHLIIIIGLYVSKQKQKKT